MDMTACCLESLHFADIARLSLGEQLGNSVDVFLRDVRIPRASGVVVVQHAQTTHLESDWG